MLRPNEFLVDLLRIESGFLPHLQLIDGAGGNVVAADEPGLLPEQALADAWLW